MMTAERVVTDLQWVEAIIARHTELQATRHTVAMQDDGRVAVEVMGAHWEARAWRHAIDGRILPSHTDVHGVRRQVVVCLRVQVCVVEYPANFGDVS